MPPAPDWFNNYSRKIYRLKSKQLMAAGLMFAIDLEMFMIFCHEFGRYIESSEWLSDFKSDTKLTSKIEFDNYYRNLRINKDSFERIKNLASEFGLTPVARLRLSKSDIEKENTIEDILL
jgi:P27 family predicted phage terminase small subunit